MQQIPLLLDILQAAVWLVCCFIFFQSQSTWSIRYHLDRALLKLIRVNKSGLRHHSQFFLFPEISYTKDSSVVFVCDIICQLEKPNDNKVKDAFTTLQSGVSFILINKFTPFMYKFFQDKERRTIKHSSPTLPWLNCKCTASIHCITQYKGFHQVSFYYYYCYVLFWIWRDDPF